MRVVVQEKARGGMLGLIIRNNWTPNKYKEVPIEHWNREFA